MELKTKRCRCCGQLVFQRLPVKAVVDPFFALHGLQIAVEHTIDIPLYDWGLRGKVDRLPQVLGQKLHRRLDLLRKKHLLNSLAIRIPYGLCEHCNFLAPWYEIGDDQLSDYYAHYLKEEYKQARTKFQPGFECLGQLMGSGEEAESRRKQHEDYFYPYLLELQKTSPGDELKLLDYGGGEGLIIPCFPWIKGAVLEIESAEASYNQNNPSYDVVQCLHVLEHVGNPLRTYQRLINYCRSGGLIYTEVPLEFPGLASINAGNIPICHEHINKFCLKSVTALLEASQVEIILVEQGEIDFLHLEGMTPVIRGVARKL